MTKVRQPRKVEQQWAAFFATTLKELKSAKNAANCCSTFVLAQFWAFTDPFMSRRVQTRLREIFLLQARTISTRLMSQAPSSVHTTIRGIATGKHGSSYSIDPAVLRDRKSFASADGSPNTSGPTGFCS